jgi:membrane dipeptidase
MYTSGPKLAREEQRALDLHYGSIVVDCSTIVKYENEHFEYARMGGVTASNHTIRSDTFRQAVDDIAKCYSWIEKNSDKGVVAESVEDIERAKKEGKTSIIFGPQNSTLVENDLNLLTIIHKLGVRIIQLTYQHRNLVGDGCGERTSCGLSSFGVDMVKKMNESHMVMDLSHCGARTVSDAMEFSNDPVIFSHTNPYSLCKLPSRAKTDEQIKALAEKGGVMGLTAYSPLCKTREVRPTLEDYLNHIDYVVNLVGADYVGTGLDLDETSSPESFERFRGRFPEISENWTWEERNTDGLTRIDLFPNITKGLVVRGYSDQEIQKILGGNFLRVFKRVWGS